MGACREWDWVRCTGADRARDSAVWDGHPPRHRVCVLHGRHPGAWNCRGSVARAHRMAATSAKRTERLAAGSRSWTARSCAASSCGTRRPSWPCRGGNLRARAVRSFGGLILGSVPGCANQRQPGRGCDRSGVTAGRALMGRARQPRPCSTRAAHPSDGLRKNRPIRFRG